MIPYSPIGRPTYIFSQGSTQFYAQVESAFSTVFGRDNLHIESSKLSEEFYGAHEAVVVDRKGVPVSVVLLRTFKDSVNTYRAVIVGNIPLEALMSGEDPARVAPTEDLSAFIKESVLQYAKAMLWLWPGV